MSHAHPPEPGAMTRRARAYLTIAGVRHGLIGASLLWLPWLYGSTAFLPILNVLPLWIWGTLMLVTAGVAAFAAALRHGGAARVGMILSAAITLVLGAGVAIGVGELWYEWLCAVGADTFADLLLHPSPELPRHLILLATIPPSPFLPLVLLTVAAKDFVVCAQPMRSPFEPAIRVILEREGHAR